MLPIDALLYAHSAAYSVLLARCPAAGWGDGDGQMLQSAVLPADSSSAAGIDNLMMLSHLGGSEQPLRPLLSSRAPLRADEMLLCICPGGRPLSFRSTAAAPAAGKLRPSLDEALAESAAVPRETLLGRIGLPNLPRWLSWEALVGNHDRLWPQGQPSVRHGAPTAYEPLEPNGCGAAAAATSTAASAATDEARPPVSPGVASAVSRCLAGPSLMALAVPAELELRPGEGRWAGGQAEEGAQTEASWKVWLRGVSELGGGGPPSAVPSGGAAALEAQPLPPPGLGAMHEKSGFRVSISRLHTKRTEEAEEASVDALSLDQRYPSPERLPSPGHPSSSAVAGVHGTDSVPGPPPSPPAAKLRGHVILCGLPEYPDSLWDFVVPLRSRARFRDADGCPALVLLQPSPPSEEASRRAMAELPSIWFVSGSCGSRHDLLRAGVQSASCIVITSAATAAARGLGAAPPDHLGEEARATWRGARALTAATRVNALYEDATALLTCRELDLWPGLRPRVLCQLRHPSNIDFLRKPPEVNYRGPSSPVPAPPLAARTMSMSVDEAGGAGGAGAPSRRLVLDRVLGVLSDELQAPHHRAGRVLSPSLIRSVVCRLLDAPRLPALLELLLLGCSSGGCLLSWLVPPPLRGRTYGELFEHFVRQLGAVPLGVLRSRPSGQQVLTALSAEEPLLAGDTIFVLTSTWTTHPSATDTR